MSEPITRRKILVDYRIRTAKCQNCGNESKLEAHHIKLSSSDVKDDTKVLMLCGEECHRNGMKLSPHSTPRAWRQTYPIQMQLDYAYELYRRYCERD